MIRGSTYTSASSIIYVSETFNTITEMVLVSLDNLKMDFIYKKKEYYQDYY